MYRQEQELPEHNFQRYIPHILIGASKWQILRQVIVPNSLPEILTGIRVAVGVCWETLVAEEFLAGTTGIGFVKNVARKYMQYEHIWITIFVMEMLGMFF